MATICRLCATVKKIDNFVNLNNSKLDLTQRIEKYCQIIIHEEDPLPKTVCIECIQTLDFCCKFISKVQESQESLEKIFHTTDDSTATNSSNCAVTMVENKNLLDKLKVFQVKTIGTNYSSSSSSNTKIESSTIRNQQEQQEQQQHHEHQQQQHHQYHHHQQQQQQEQEDSLNSIAGNQDDADDVDNAICVKFEENYDDEIYEIAEVHLNNENEFISEEEINGEQSQIDVNDGTIEMLSATHEEPDDADDDNVDGDVNNDDDDDVTEYDNAHVLVEHMDIVQEEPEEEQQQQKHSQQEEHYQQQQEQQHHSTLQQEQQHPEHQEDEEEVDEGEHHEELLKADIIIESWNSYPWMCFSCSIVYTNPIQLREHHSRKHRDSGNLCYTCVDCFKVMDRYYTFVNHVKCRHREQLQLSCDLCSKNFKTIQEAANHRNASHPEDDSPESLILCTTCGKGFKNQNAVQIHANCHQPDDVKYKFACDVCNKRFATKPNLRAHEKIHAGIKDFVCDQCGKGFVQKANLEEHLVTHVNDTPYACTECDKRFKTSARLVKHKLIHTDIKPHKCEECGRVFREKDTLRVHSRIHTGAMPYECEFCGKKFRFKSVLSTHRHQHTGERPYSCLECNHHFTNWPNYNKHMKRRHGINTSSRKPQTIRESANIKQKYKDPMSSAGSSSNSRIKAAAADSVSDLVTSTTEILNLVSDDTPNMV